VCGIKCERHEDEIFAEIAGKAALQLAEIIRDAETEVRQNAVRVGEGERDNFAAEVAELYLVVKLVS
jgi:hypothetical protein